MEVRSGYKQTEVGVIPADWDIKPLSYVCKQQGIVRGPFGGALKKEIFVSHGFKVFEQKNAIYKNCEIGNYYVDGKKFNELRRFEVAAGDFIVSCSGTIGCIYQIPSNSPAGIINQALLKLTLDDSFVDPGYFYAFFQWEKFQSHIIDSTQGGAMRNLVGMPIFKSTPLVIPPLKEQRAIATALSDMDALLDGLDRLIAKKRAIKQAAMQQLLTGQTRLPGFSGEWEVRRLGDHLTVLKNGVNSRAELSYNEDIRYLHYGDIHGSSQVMLDPASVEMPCLPRAKASRLDRLQDGDLIYADASEDMDGVGKSVEIQNATGIDLVSGLHTIAIRFDKSVLADGFKAYIQFIPKFCAHLRQLAAGTKVYATNRAHIASAELRLPGIDEQQAISALLTDMEAEITALETRRTKTRSLKQALMQELLTGRTRLVKGEKYD